VTGTVSDDGLPSGNLTTYWEMQSGPGTVLFANAGALSTTATFSTSGTYVLILTANDTAATGSGTCYVTVNPATEGPFGGTAWAVPCRIEAENYDVGGRFIVRMTLISAARPTPAAGISSIMSPPASGSSTR
jgi:hypothetical protein